MMIDDDDDDDDEDQHFDDTIDTRVAIIIRQEQLPL